MAKVDDAVKKLRAEMDSNKTNAYVQAVGAMLLLHLEEHPDAADTILADGKTITKSLDVMRKAAEKKKVGSVAVLTDAEGFAVVLDYFKQPDAPAAAPAAKADPETKQAPKTKSKKDEPKPEEPKPEEPKPEEPKPEEPKPEEPKPEEPKPEEPAEESDDDFDFDALLE